MIYFLQAPNGEIKIGYTHNIVQRQRAIESKMHIKCSLLAVRDGGRDEERAAHQMFAAHRLHGEWFSPASDVLAFVDNPLIRLVPLPSKSIPAGLVKMSVFVSQELREKLRKLAVADGRSDTKYAAKALEAHVEREERKAKVVA